MLKSHIVNGIEVVTESPSYENKYFADSKNTKVIEQILNYRLKYDLALAGAKRGVTVRAYEEEVDNRGIDIIFTDGENSAFTQIKTKRVSSSTSSWKILKDLIRPNRYHYDKFPLLEPTSSGKGGSVILMEYFLNDGSIHLNYYYTDAYIIYAALSNMIRTREKRFGRGTAIKVFQEMASSTNKYMNICRSYFVPVASSDALLCMMGLHSIYHPNCRTDILRYTENWWKNPSKEKDYYKDVVRSRLLFYGSKDPN